MKIFDIEKARKESDRHPAISAREQEIITLIMATAKRGRYNTAENPIHLSDAEVTQLKNEGFTVDWNRQHEGKSLYVICW